jgi:hypothetical protein
LKVPTEEFTVTVHIKGEEMTEVQFSRRTPSIRSIHVVFFILKVLVPFINALIIHDSEGDRLFAKYFDGRSKSQQKEFETLLQKKTKSMPAKNEGMLYQQK